MADSRHDQQVEYLLKLILESLTEIEADVDEINQNVEKLVPTPGAVSAMLTLTANP